MKKKEIQNLVIKLLVEVQSHLYKNNQTLRQQNIAHLMHILNIEEEVRKVLSNNGIEYNYVPKLECTLGTLKDNYQKLLRGKSSLL
jgi:hypothetical protein